MNVEYLPIDSLRPFDGLKLEISDKDYARLRESIARNGIRMPLIVCKNVVVCGCNRLRAATELGISFVPCLRLPDSTDALTLKAVAIEDNLARRHLTTVQKVELALELLEIEKVKAKARQSEAGRQNIVKSDPEEDRDSLSLTGEKGKAIDIAAQKAGVSPTTVKIAKEVKEKSPDLWRQVKSNEKSIHGAYKELKKAAIPSNTNNTVTPTHAKFIEDLQKIYTAVIDANSRAVDMLSASFLSDYDIRVLTQNVQKVKESVDSLLLKLQEKSAVDTVVAA